MLFECHITCRVGDAAICESVAEAAHWKTSQIERDPLLGDDTYFYLTTHGSSFIGINRRMNIVANELRFRGAEVVREKI